MLRTECLRHKAADDVPPPNDETSAVDIEWFNKEYFNVGNGVCMTNMLLSSYYDTAADIDLYELFYNGRQEYRKRSLRQNRQRSAGGV